MQNAYCKCMCVLYLCGCCWSRHKPNVCVIASYSMFWYMLRVGYMHAFFAYGKCFIGISAQRTCGTCMCGMYAKSTLYSRPEYVPEKQIANVCADRTKCLQLKSVLSSIYVLQHQHVLCAHTHSYVWLLHAGGMGFEWAYVGWFFFARSVCAG